MFDQDIVRLFPHTYLDWFCTYVILYMYQIKKGFTISKAFKQSKLKKAIQEFSLVTLALLDPSSY